MERENVQVVVRTTLTLMARLAKRTRTQADDLMVAMLQANEDRLVEAVLKLPSSPDRPPTEEQIAEALAAVGIRV
jgi:hypothetical protein